MPKTKILFFPLFTVLFILPFQKVSAQNEQKRMPFATLDSLVVTATRMPLDYRETGRRVVVYTAEEIAAQPAQTVAGLLRTIGGVAVQSRAGFGVQSDFSMRGSSFKGVLILLDGVPINGPQTAHYLSDFPVPLSAIARIEVMRGTGSSLYGPNAIGGVIHIFTYAGLRTTKTPAVESEGGLHTKYGSHQLYDVGGSFRQSFGKTTVYAATAWQGTDGEPIFANGKRVRSINGPLSTYFNRQTHTIALTHELDEAMFYARAGMDRRDLNAYHFYTGFDSDRARANNRTYWLQARLRNNISEQTHWSLQMAAKQHEGLYVYNPKFESSRDYARKLVLQGKVSRVLSPVFTLTGGFSTEYQGITSISMGNHNHLSGGIYVGANWQATDHFTVNGSSRIDYDMGYGVEVTPQLSLAYNRNKFTFRAAGGRAVRAPTYTELYINTAVENFSGGNLGNPGLSAEQVWSAEAGIDYYLTSGVSLHSTVFYRTVDNLIDWSRLPGQDLYVARNILHADTRGLEIGLNVTQYFEGSQLSFNAFYTLLHKEIGAATQNVDYKYALKGARQFIQGSLQFDKGPLTLALRGLWKDRRSRKSYSVIHSRAAYRLPIAGRRLSVSLSVRNIFDTEYSDIFDAPMPGRWFIFGVGVDL